MEKETNYREYETSNKNIHFKDKIHKNSDSLNKNTSLNLQENHISDNSIIFEDEEEYIIQNSSSIEISK